MTAAEDRAPDALRAALLENAQDWQAALALKAALAARGQYAEGDPVFRQARRHFPDAAWVAHLAGLYAFSQGELPDLIARARDLAIAQPDNPARAALLGRMLDQARDYAGAAAAYACDPRPEARAWESASRRAEACARWLTAAPSFGPAPAMAVINLDRNTERLADIRHHFAGCAPPRFRVAGVEGSRLVAPAIARLRGDAAMRGTLGCFLAHAAAWEAMLARGLPHCLVVEDDVIPLFHLPARWGMFGLPRDFDICFVNDRLAPPAREAAFRVHTLFEAMHAFPAWRNAPGADGYLLSAAGARTLLDYVARDGFAGDVDWRLLAYGLTGAECRALPAGSHACGTLSALPHGTGGGLAAFVLSPALIRTVPLASDREDENRAGAAVSRPAQSL